MMCCVSSEVSAFSEVRFVLINAAFNFFFLTNITGTDKRVLSGRCERKELAQRVEDIFLNRKGVFLRFEVRFTAACAYVMSELKTPSFLGRLIQSALWDLRE